jgi:hypothetical protein
MRVIFVGNIPLNPIPEQIAQMQRIKADILAALPSRRRA